MKRIGFLINPIAGMGGRVGLKGTDGVIDQAVRLGARPIAGARAAKALRRLRTLVDRSAGRADVRWITCTGTMGATCLNEAGFADIDAVYQAGEETGHEDTIEATRRFVANNVELILFCGGDGTARDICGVTGRDTPILGIPSGVKMFSGVFGTTPEHTADIVFGVLQDRLDLADVEILDLDEEKYRGGEWAVRLYHSARTPYEPALTQASKSLIGGASEHEAKADIAKSILDEYQDQPGMLLLLGAGSTLEAVGDVFGIDKTLLGIDAVADGALVGKDLNERQLLDLLARYPERRLILSPIGAQGFVLGRGNLQISPRVIREIGRDNIVVVSTPAKLSATPMLRFDTGDPSLDAELSGRGYIAALTGYRFSQWVKVAG